MIWYVPGVLLVVVAVPVVLAMRRCAAEASALRRSLGEFAELAPLARQLQLEASALVSEVPVALRRRSVVAAPSRAALPAGESSRVRE